MHITREDYGGWPNCYRLSNGLIDLVVTTDVGPRIIRFGFVGGENEFKEYTETLGQAGGDSWRIYGGHRLWVAPEDRLRTYVPDNERVRFEGRGDCVRLTQTADAITGIEKTIEIRVAPDKPEVRVLHTLTNRGANPLIAAPWALSVMAPGGEAVIPVPPRSFDAGNLLPTSAIALWPYTDLSDPRFGWEAVQVTVRQDETAESPQKLGFVVPDGWSAYTRKGHRFVKRFEYDPTARYPDFGSNVEVYTNSEMLELETLGPLSELTPGASVDHVEAWELRP